MIYLVRHGQTELNQKHRLLGRTDVPLNETGISQAQAVAALFQKNSVVFDAVYSSPLKRAVQTAKILAPNAPVITDERLIEMDYGPFEGMNLHRPSVKVIPFFLDFAHTPAPEGMEPLESVKERTLAFLQEFCCTDETILISTHAIAMKGILENLTPSSNGSYWSKHIGNCEIYAFGWTKEGFSVPRPWPKN